MQLLILGGGYVGLVASVCFADLGCSVTCLDTNSEKVAMLKKGHSPIYEEGLEDVLQKNLASGRLEFTDKLENVSDNIDVVIVAVGTPENEDGSANLCYLEDAVMQILDRFGEISLSKSIALVIKSTVPIGTAKSIKQKIKESGKASSFHIISNPEFLREGSAVKDFMYPDRVVIGVDGPEGREAASRLYAPFLEAQVPVLFTDNQTAEIIKYASNAYLAMRIAFINEMADLCEACDGNIKDVSRGIGMDKRIGKQYLNPGPGFGGSCFPKDTKALVYTAKKLHQPLGIIEAVIDSNEERKIKMAARAASLLAKSGGKRAAILGLAFKADTDDIRDSASLYIIRHLLKCGIEVRAYDPQAMEHSKKIFGDNIYYASNAYDCLEEADLVVIVTEWGEFRELDTNQMRSRMRRALMLDLRHIYSDQTMDGWDYTTIGLK
jgi:UDPglucose 6-dehydrogenase